MKGKRYENFERYCQLFSSLAVDDLVMTYVLGLFLILNHLVLLKHYLIEGDRCLSL